MHHIEKLNGKSVLVCQMFNQLKPDEFYDWINQVNFEDTQKYPLENFKMLVLTKFISILGKKG